MNIEYQEELIETTCLDSTSREFISEFDGVKVYRDYQTIYYRDGVYL